MKRLVPPIPMVLLAAACVDEEQPRLLIPMGIEVAWEEGYNLEGDGLGALVPVDVMVYDGGTGEALSGVPLEVWTSDPGAWPVPAEGVALVDPELDQAWWDAATDQFVQLELGDDPLALVTDATGLARSYVFVDSFGAGIPPDGLTSAERAAPLAAEYDAIEVSVSMDADPDGAAETIVLHPW